MQWRKNRLAIGAAVFLALLGLTVWATTTRDRVPQTSELPTVEAAEADVTSIEIHRPKEGGSDLVILAKVDGDWRLTVPLEAEADATSVQSALSRLDSLRVSGVAATRPENYARLEVDDAQAVKVVVHTAQDEDPLILRLGKFSGGMTMARIGDRDEVFSIEGSVRHPFDKDLKAWRNRKVTELAVENLTGVAYESPNGSFQFERQDGNWTPAPGQRRIKDFDPKQVEALVSTAARLTATGFAPADVSAARAGLGDPKATVILEVGSPETKDTDAEAKSNETEEAPSTIVLEIGDETASGTEFFLRRLGNDTIYVVSSYLADRLRPDASAFEKRDEPPPPPPGAAPGAIPGQQQPQLPPEIMEQLQRQIQQQQQQAR